jgi:dolichyl-diphosphooligosaccharide--protein glycosyltransferase
MNKKSKKRHVIKDGYEKNGRLAAQVATAVGERNQRAKRAEHACDEVAERSEPNGGRDRMSREVIVLSILFLIAFFVRMITYSSIFVGNNVRFLEFDPFYHMRRVVSFAVNFPHIWSFDTYIDYPYGNAPGWPPLYDWTIALISNIIGLGHPSRHLIETVGVYFPVFIGSLSVIVIYFLSKDIFSGRKNGENWKIGVISGLLLAVIPAFTQVSFLGFVDHHVAEVLLSTTIYLFFLKALNADNSNKRFKFLFIAGLVLILAILTLPDVPIFIGIILAYIVVQSIVDKNYRYLSMIIGTILILCVGLYILFPETYQNLSSGIGFLLKDSTLSQQVKETQPLFFTFEGTFTLGPAWYAFNTALYIAIAGIILIFIRVAKRSLELTKARVMFLVWTLIVLVLNLYQTRFIYLFAVNIVILCAYLISELIGSRKTDIKIIGIILFIAILVPSIQTNNIMRQYPLMLSNDWFTSLQWLKDNTPNPINGGNNDSNNSINNGSNSNVDDILNIPSKDRVPEYGIMSWWDYGNYILYLSERPVVANNFQLGAEDSAKFLASENESSANQIMNKRKAKYVIVDYGSGLNVLRSGNTLSIRGSWISVAFLLGKDLNYYLDNGIPNQNYLNTTYARLYLFDGKGMENYKLIYKSPTRYPDIFNRPIEEIKIFQYTAS